MPTLAEIRAVPKVLLHDHLDGGLRPRTVLELARETGYSDLPADNAAELAQRLTEGAHRGHLEIYLDAFRHTVGVMQTAEALYQVAAECAEDLATDRIVLRGSAVRPRAAHRARAEPGRGGAGRACRFRQWVAGEGRHGITVYALLTAMRTAARSLEIAELAVRHRNKGVVGFDIAGAKAGWPPSRHLDAFQYVKRENFHITIHAGEGFGLPSIWEAVQVCGAERLGHGVRIVDDIQITRQGQGAARAAGGLYARPPESAGNVPDLERADRRGAVDRAAPDPTAPPAVVPGDGEHRQPADEPGHAQLGVPPAGQANSATAGPTSNG